MTDNEKCVKCAFTLTWFGVLDSVVLVALKGVVGLATHSRALTMSAVYSIHDVISSLAILMGLKVSDLPPDAEHPFGYGKMEFVSSFLIGLITLIATLFLMGEAIWILAHDDYPMVHWLALIAALIAALVNETIARFNICAYKHINSPSILMHAHHHRADALSSMATVFAVISVKAGLYFMDPLVAILEAAHLIFMSAEILYESALGLMDRAPEKTDIANIRRIAAKVSGAETIKNIKARRIGRKLWVDLHIRLDSNMTMGEAEQTSEQIRQALDRGLEHIGTINVVHV